MQRFACSILILSLLTGCATNQVPPTTDIDVFVGQDGHLSSGHYALNEADLPAFAREVGDQKVIVNPLTSNGNEVDFGKAVKARDMLKAAGVKNVVLVIAAPA